MKSCLVKLAFFLLETFVVLFYLLAEYEYT